MTRRAQPSVFSITVARAAAKGHYEAGLSSYKQFELLATAKGPQPPDHFLAIMESWVPAVTNVALSLELLLKILHFQHHGRYPEGHDVSLLGKFDEPTMDRLRAEYKALKADPAKPTFLTMKVGQGSSRPDAPNGWPGEADTYDSAIDKIGKTYVLWRYIYETFGETINFAMSFEHLVLLVKCLDNVISSFKGTTTIVVGTSQAAADPGEA